MDGHIANITSRAYVACALAMVVADAIWMGAPPLQASAGFATSATVVACDDETVGAPAADVDAAFLVGGASDVIDEDSDMSEIVVSDETSENWDGETAIDGD